MRGLLAGVVMALLGCSAWAASLDTPLAQQPPTLRTEIKRGGDIAFQCGLDARGDEEIKRHCVEHAQLANEQGAATRHDAFDAGLYFSAFAIGAVDDRQFYWSLYLISRHKAGVSDSAVVEALAMTPAALAGARDAAAQWGD